MAWHYLSAFDDAGLVVVLNGVCLAEFANKESFRKLLFLTRGFDKRVNFFFCRACY